MNNPYYAIRAFASSSAGRELVKDAARTSWDYTKMAVTSSRPYWGRMGISAGVGAVAGGFGGGYMGGPNHRTGGAIAGAVAGAGLGAAGMLGWQHRAGFRGIASTYWGGAKNLMRPGMV